MEPSYIIGGNVNWCSYYGKQYGRIPAVPGAVDSMLLGFPAGSEVKAFACNAGDPGSIPGSERSPGEGNGNPLQYCCLKNSMKPDELATVRGITKSWAGLSD